jgi:geranylgeranyl pyrophosphate synthase
LDIQKIVSELEREKDRINRAIAALVESASSGPTTRKISGAGKTAAPGRGKRRRGGLTPAGRRRLSEAMKKRWAERKRKKS